MRSEPNNEQAPATAKKRLFARAVMAGSVAPASAGWLFPNGWKQLAEKPLRARLITYTVIGLALVLAGFCIWAISSAHGVLAAYALLGFMAIAIGAPLLLLARVVLVAALRRQAAHRD